MAQAARGDFGEGDLGAIEPPAARAARAPTDAGSVAARLEDVLLRSPLPARIASRHVERAAIVVLGLLAFLPYLAINSLTASWPAVELTFWLDDLVPFDVRWQFVYVSIFLVAYAPATVIKDPPLLRRAFYGYLAVLVVSYAVFLAMPATMQRSEALIGTERFVEWGLALNYWLDAPRNLFPSLHVANAFLVGFELWRLDRLLGALAGAAALLIAYATLAVKQHCFADLAGALALAYAIHRLVFVPGIPRGVPPRALCFPRAAALILPVAYGLGVATLYVLWASGWRPFPWPPV